MADQLWTNTYRPTPTDEPPGQQSMQSSVPLSTTTTNQDMMPLLGDQADPSRDPSRDPNRITIKKGNFVIKDELKGEQEVVLLGSNYVMKASPWFPEEHVVKASARTMRQNFEAMRYRGPEKDTGYPVVKPCVRLGCLMEGAMPQGPSMEVDLKWARKLERTIRIFASKGIYVFLDIHQDAFCSSNGGNGMPTWMAVEMQNTASYKCCATCGYGRKGTGCTLPGFQDASYIVTPNQPLKLAVNDSIAAKLKAKDAQMPSVVTPEGEDNPWGPHAYGNRDGLDPRDMNIGNLAMRLNNNDAAWERGTLLLSEQVQNIASRFWNSPTDVGRHGQRPEDYQRGDMAAQRWAAGGDKAAFFDPYMTFVKYLCGLWGKYWNVVAVELFNEPPVGGLPNPFAVIGQRRSLFNFYDTVLMELDKERIRTPVAIEDLWGTTISGGNKMLGATTWLAPPVKRAREWAQRGQLIYSFHWHPGLATQVGLKQMLLGARKDANDMFGVCPLWLSEYGRSKQNPTFQPAKEEAADTMAYAATFGINAVTHWQFVDSAMTGVETWSKYPQNKNEEECAELHRLFTTLTPESMQARNTIPRTHTGGGLFRKEWEAYQQTVAKNTYWGAHICGSGYAVPSSTAMNILSSLPETAPLLDNDQPPSTRPMAASPVAAPPQESMANSDWVDPQSSTPILFPDFLATVDFGDSVHLLAPRLVPDGQNFIDYMQQKRLKWDNQITDEQSNSVVMKWEFEVGKDGKCIVQLLSATGKKVAEFRERPNVDGMHTLDIHSDHLHCMIHAAPHNDSCYVLSPLHGQDGPGSGSPNRDWQLQFIFTAPHAADAKLDCEDDLGNLLMAATPDGAYSRTLDIGAQIDQSLMVLSMLAIDFLEAQYKEKERIKESVSPPRQAPTSPENASFVSSPASPTSPVRILS